MSWIILVTIAVFLAGILYLNSGTPSKKKTREELLSDLAKALEGKTELIDGFENSYRITFDFDGYTFFYEDVEAVGFNNTIFKAYLKISTPSKLTLTFGEKHRTKLIEHSKTVKHGIVKLPKDFPEYGAYSNNPALAEEFLNDTKIIKILKKFRDFGQSGKPRLFVKINSGTIILEFDPTGGSIHKPLRLVTETSVIEEYLDQMLVLTKRLESI